MVFDQRRHVGASCDSSDFRLTAVLLTAENWGISSFYGVLFLAFLKAPRFAARPGGVADLFDGECCCTCDWCEKVQEKPDKFDTERGG